jgi:uncharacterized membrane protein
MVAHVSVLGWLGLARSLVGAGLGAYLIWKATDLGPRDYGMVVDPETLAFDAAVFLWVGVALAAISLLRLIQSLLVLLGPRARWLGMALALFDMANLVFFPVSTALGVYAFVVYRHPEAAERFRARRAAG